jgi:hypothetical protein
MRIFTAQYYLDFEGYCCLHSRLYQHYSLSLPPTQAWSLLPARASVLHAHSLYAAAQDSPIYIHVLVRSSEWAGNVHARWSLARRT